jgi:glycosyltransferase involved in cell wall biosynthesis
VLVVTTAWPHTVNPSYGIFVKREVDELRRLGVRSDVVFVRGYVSRLAYPMAFRHLSRSGRSRSYKLVHAYGGEAALVASCFRGAPLVVTYLGSDLLGSPRSSGRTSLAWRVRRSVIRGLSRLPARTFTRSAEMEAALPATVRRRNAILPAGVDDSLFQPGDQQEARRVLGWVPKGRVALFASNPQIPGKRYALAEAAVQRARAQLPDIRLHVLQGAKPDEVPAAMNAADCLLLTSWREGSPNVVKEAVMCNLPVVTTRVGDVEDTLRGVSPSWICSDSPNELGAALVTCLHSPCRSNGRSNAGQLTGRKIAERVLATYEQVADHPLTTTSGGA